MLLAEMDSYERAGVNRTPPPQSGTFGTIGTLSRFVGAYEEGRSDPRLNNLLKMCEVFSISLDNILRKDVSKLREENYLDDNNQKVKVLSS